MSKSRESVATQICKKCGKRKSLDEFYFREKINYRLKICKECYCAKGRQDYVLNKEKVLKKCKEYKIKNKEAISKRNKQYNKLHKTEISEYHKRHYQANKVEINARHRKHYSENKERTLEKHREWRKQNGDYHAFLTKQWKIEHKDQFNKMARVRMRLKRAKRKKAFIEEIDENIVYNDFNGICQLCYEPIDRETSWPDPMSFTIDHIIPEKNRGGVHSYRNLVPAHYACNISKHEKLYIRDKIELARILNACVDMIDELKKEEIMSIIEKQVFCNGEIRYGIY